MNKVIYVQNRVEIWVKIVFLENIHLTQAYLTYLLTYFIDLLSLRLLQGFHGAFCENGNPLKNITPSYI